MNTTCSAMLKMAEEFIQELYLLTSHVSCSLNVYVVHTGSTCNTRLVPQSQTGLIASRQRPGMLSGKTGDGICVQESAYWDSIALSEDLGIRIPLLSIKICVFGFYFCI